MFKILDCTLRDGGYYTNWDFDKELVNVYLDSFNKLPVDYLEIGYRSNPMNEYLGEYFYCPEYVLEDIKNKSTKKLVIILDEKDVKPEHINNLLKPCVGIISMVRIALDPKNLTRALKLAEAIKRLGFEIGFNVMYMSKWKQNQTFMTEINQVDPIADYFYMVDSYGGVFPEELKEIMNIVKGKTNCKIGFHGHNNIELALINTLTAIANGAEIVDATVTGMGRGAGNLKTELLLTTLNATNKVPIDFNALSNVVDGFKKLQQNYEWGTNLPYMVSGANSLPQKDVMEWVSKRYYSFNSIIRALNNQKTGIEDNEKLQVFQPKEKFKKAILIGGGPSATIHSRAIKEYIKKEKQTCIIHASSKNAIHYSEVEMRQYFALVGSEGHRLEQVFSNLGDFKGQCVLPPFPRAMGTYIPEAVIGHAYELKEVDFIDKLKDAHTSLAIQIALDLKVEEIELVGYDGYNQEVISVKEQELFRENEYIFFEALKMVKITSLLPTQYSSVYVDSVYSKLI